MIAIGFEKGRSGNPLGRRRLTEEERCQKEEFKKLLSASTVSALQGIVQIANDRRHKDRLKACTYLVDKAYGSNTAFLLDGTEENAPVVIRVVPGEIGSNEDDWEQEWNEAPDEFEGEWDDEE